MVKSTKKLRTRKSTLSLPHVIVKAGPGSGKTASGVAGLNLIKGVKPDWYKLATDEQLAIWEAMEGVYHSIAFQAFNKPIAVELQKKVPDGVKASTFHSFCYGALREAGYKFRISGDNVKYMVKDMMGYDRKESMKQEDYEKSNIVARLVSLFKNNLLPVTDKNILMFAEEFDLEINGTLKDIKDLCIKVMDKCKDVKVGQQAWIDFDDMLWLTIVLDLDFSSVQCDLLLCDEAQDLNPLQHKIVLKTGLRLFIIGDVRQAIYGFRGADSESMDTLKSILEKTDRGVIELPLQTSFRLPKSGVRNVQEFAPDLKALPDAIEGEVKECFIDQADPQVGDLVVSRINKNIFIMAFGLLKKRVPVRIQGREFGTQLLNVIKKTCNKNDDISAAIATIQEFDHTERLRLSKKTFGEKLVDGHAEKVACLMSLTEGCKTVQDMIDTIEKLFDQDLKKEDVVLLSTIHRAKGLEAKNVFFLEPQLVPHPMAKKPKQRAQEFNLKFVAETRHMETLTYIYPRDDEDTRDEEEGREIEDTEVDCSVCQQPIASCSC
jgi:superfamily I DNA/RNA helicase